MYRDVLQLDWHQRSVLCIGRYLLYAIQRFPAGEDFAKHSIDIIKMFVFPVSKKELKIINLWVG